MMRELKMGLILLNREYPDDEACERFFEECRWGKGKKICPFCGKIYEEEDKISISADGRYICGNKNCKGKFSVITNTFLACRQATLSQWFNALCYVMLGKGVSTARLAEYIGIKSEAARNMILKIGHLARQDNKLNLGDDVAMDEVYIGGNPKNRHEDERDLFNYEKTPVIGMIGLNKYVLDEFGKIKDFTKKKNLSFFDEIKEEAKKRKGAKEKIKKEILIHSQIFLKVLAYKKPGEKVCREDVYPLIYDHIPRNKPTTIVQTDESPIYDDELMWGKRRHIKNRHKLGQFTIKDLYYHDDPDDNEFPDFEIKSFTSNGIEGVFAELKKVLIGTHNNSISAYYLQKYINIFCFRWNNRPLNVLDRVKKLLENMDGSQITDEELKVKGKKIKKTAEEKAAHKYKFYHEETEEMNRLINRTLDAIKPEIKDKLKIIIKEDGTIFLSDNIKAKNRTTYNKIMGLLSNEIPNTKYYTIKNLQVSVRKEIEKEKEKKYTYTKWHEKQQEANRLIRDAIALVSKEEQIDFGFMVKGKKGLIRSEDFSENNEHTIARILYILRKNGKMEEFNKTVAAIKLTDPYYSAEYRD